MPKEKSAGSIVFYEEEGEPLYLLLHYPSAKKAKKEYWDFPKGHGKANETEEQTVRREVKEETSLEDLEFIRGFHETINYMFQAEGKRIFKTVVFYLASTKTKKVNISFEHVGYKWLPFAEAMKQLKFANAKKLLTKARPLAEQVTSAPLREYV